MTSAPGESRNQPRPRSRRGLLGLGRLARVPLALAVLAGVLSQLPLVGPADRALAVAPATPWLAPAPDAVLERIAFGSCLHQARPQPIWPAVLAMRPQLFLMLGDNVYGDVKDASLLHLREAYARQAARTELAALRARVPVLATWDDHDYGRNDAGREFPWKDGARRLFAEFWQLSTPALPPGGIYRSASIGPAGRRVQVILLDTRSFRGPLAPRPRAEVLADRSRGRYLPSEAAEQDMLGAAQWQWLEAELRKPADVRLIVSSVQVLADSHGWERWGNLPKERRRLFDLIARTGASGVVLLSGDRHRAALYVKADARPYAIPEVSTSSLNMAFPGADAPDPNRPREEMFTGENFGAITIDWQRRRLRLAIHAGDGREVDGLEIGLDALAP